VAVKRGDIVVVAARGPYTGKPRPALVVQSDLFNPTHSSVSVCLITTEFVEAPLFRVAVAPGALSGLKKPSQIMTDKIVSIPRDQITSIIGAADDATLDQVGAALRLWLSL
jgi:mRNA interferase MazF